MVLGKQHARICTPPLADASASSGSGHSAARDKRLENANPDIVVTEALPTRKIYAWARDDTLPVRDRDRRRAWELSVLCDCRSYAVALCYERVSFGSREWHCCVGQEEQQYC